MKGKIKPNATFFYTQGTKYGQLNKLNEADIDIDGAVQC